MMEGKRLIAGMVLGGWTQYRTSVQEMSRHVEDMFVKILRNFMWGESSCPTIGLDTLMLPHERGGKKVLNIRSRNEVIELMKVKRYLNLGPNRPV